MPRIPVRLNARLLAVTTAVFALSAPARADLIPIGAIGTDGVTVIATGTLSVEHLSSTQAAIQLTLNNTCPTGQITGFGFCDPLLAAQATSVTSFTSQCGTGSTDFRLLTGTNSNLALGTVAGVDATLGAAVILGEGNGLGVGECGTFTFQVLGTDVSALTAANLLACDGIDAKLRLGLCLDPNRTSCTSPITCVPCCADCPPPPCPSRSVPAPPGVALAGIGFGSLLLGRFFRRSAALRLA